MNESDFAAQRNRIHYRNNHWVMADLHDYVTDDTFGRQTFETEPLLDVDQRDFSCLLSYIILDLAYALFRDLAAIAGGLANEISVLRASLGRECHSLYRAAYAT
jgi:hypothetical protein